MKYIIFLLSLGLPIGLYAGEGGTVGNGGDTFVIQFLSTARQGRDLLQKTQVKLIPLSKFSDAIVSTAVESTEQDLYIGGVKKDGINYPLEKRIIFNRQAWAAIKDQQTRLVFVIHEFLGIIEMDDSHYQVSNEVVKQIISKQNPSILPIQYFPGTYDSTIQVRTGGIEFVELRNVETGERLMSCREIFRELQIINEVCSPD